MKIIALDLDGTLLNSRKEVSPRTYRTLELAAAQGHWIVPATGRALMALPDEVLAFPFLRYVISINGASITDQTADKTLYSATIPVQVALDLLAFAKQFDCMYDCYWQNTGWANEYYLERVPYYCGDEEAIKLILRSRHPVKCLDSFIENKANDVQKVQLFFRDPEERKTAIQMLHSQFPDIIVTSSFRNNLELNWKTADKGRALLFLADHLHIPVEDTIAFGDSSNDLAMLRAAGTGVAMGNASDEVKAACHAVTDTNDRDGVAVYIEQNLL